MERHIVLFVIKAYHVVVSLCTVLDFASLQH